MNIRKFAEGKTCTLRIPYACDGGTETTVLAHLRRASVAGMGQKPNDLCAIFCCGNCHGILDKREPMPVWLTQDDLDILVLDALCRTLSLVGPELGV